jgi:integrase
VRDTERSDGSRDQVTIKDERVDSLNAQFAKGILNQTDAELRFRALIKDLKAAAGIKDRVATESLVNDINMRAFKDFWRARYALNPKVKPQTKVTTKHEFMRALALLGNLSIVDVAGDVLQEHWNSVANGRKYGIKINQLLRHLGRGITLALPNKIHKPIQYIDERDLPRLLSHIDTVEGKYLAQVLYATGARIGEAYAFTRRMLRSDNSIYIERQMLRNGEIDQLKNERPHTTVIIADYKEAFYGWCEVENKKALRNTLDREISRAARSAWPKDKERQISPHDLRHSFAIHMLGTGLSLSDIAMMLGDDEQTVREYYTGFVMKDRQISRINELINGGKKK